jgi:hypothetical protein
MSGTDFGIDTLCTDFDRTVTARRERWEGFLAEAATVSGLDISKTIDGNPVSFPVYILEDEHEDAVEEGVITFGTLLGKYNAPFTVVPYKLDPTRIDDVAYLKEQMNPAQASFGPNSLLGLRHRYGVVLSDNHLPKVTSKAFGGAQQREGVDVLYQLNVYASKGEVPSIACALITTNGNIVPTEGDATCTPKLNRRGVGLPMVGRWKQELYKQTGAHGDMEIATMYFLTQLFAGKERVMNPRYARPNDSRHLYTNLASKNKPLLPF